MRFRLSSFIHKLRLSALYASTLTPKAPKVLIDKVWAIIGFQDDCILHRVRIVPPGQPANLLFSSKSMPKLLCADCARCATPALRICGRMIESRRCKIEYACWRRDSARQTHLALRSQNFQPGSGVWAPGTDLPLALTPVPTFRDRDTLKFLPPQRRILNRRQRLTASPAPACRP